MKKIVLTGGGTAGHVTPNIALIPSLKDLGFEILYIGSKDGMEKKLIARENLPYEGISSGKLRRYFSLKNFSDPFRVIHGCGEAKKILRDFHPDIVFSKGGFVSVPVVLAAHSLKIPVIIHESDMTPGLANKICYRSADKICCSFPETMKMLPAGKGVLTGSPIRKELLSGSREKGAELTGFPQGVPVILVIGGSLGSVTVNTSVRECLPELLKEFRIIHICGKGNLDPSLTGKDGYLQYEFVSDDLKDLFALSDLIISRAGANAILEILSLRKPNVLIPLSAAASRGDQVLNAKSFASSGYSYVLEEENLTKDSLLKAVHATYENRQTYIAAMEKSPLSNGVEKIISLIQCMLPATPSVSSDDTSASKG